ncbi:MAG: polysaccharide deacetylase family protein [Cytophagales bacterium]|nr:polysaccharide deacetylase family protein [Armatimonadota bacterium]
MLLSPPLPSVAPAARAHGRRHGVTLLVWHDIVPSDKLVWFDTTVREFDAQLARLARAGAVPISLEALYRYLAVGSPLPPPGAVVLCFDDNTQGIYDHAFPKLARHGWSFAVSAHTRYVGVKTGKAHCGWDELRTMARGGAQIVSQTHTHPPDLRLLGDAALAREMTVSRQIMTREMGAPPQFLTYPSGKWDRRVALAGASAGYRLGLTEDPGMAEASPHQMGLHRYSTHKRFGEAAEAVSRSSRGQAGRT